MKESVNEKERVGERECVSMREREEKKQNKITDDISRKKERKRLVSLFNDISTFEGYLMPKMLFDSKLCYNFPKGISPKGNVIT